MLTLTQPQPNRQDAQHSAHLQAGEPKQSPSRNTVTIPNESQTLQTSDDLSRLIAAYAETYQPENEAEQTLIRQFALATIRLRRLEQLEEKLCEQNEPGLNQLSQCERIRASAERSFFRNYQALEKLRKQRNKTNPKPEPQAVEQIKPELAPKRDRQAELDAIVCRPMSLAEIDALLGSRSRRSQESS